MAYSESRFSTPPVVMNLLIINVIVFIATQFMRTGLGGTILNYGALHFWAGGQFRIYQLVTYMFLHANFSHIFFNMFALWMFGRVIENDLGSKRFLLYYLICGIGAGLIQLGVNWIEYSSVLNNGASPNVLYAYANASTIGASGSVYGLLLAFGMLHPNSRIMLLFPPVALKAKWFVIIYGVIELFAGISGTGGSVAHFAHLGGMLFGFALLWWWKKKGKLYY